MGKVAALGCILCHELGNGYVPAEVHHIREGQGTSQRASDYLTIPLCPFCHRGTNGVHGDRTLLRMVKMSELELLALTLERLS